MVIAITHQLLWKTIGCHLKNILAYGENHYNISTPGSEHAEICALKQLRTISRRSKHLKSIDLIVIRITNGSKLGVSKMCEKCVIGAATIPQKYGYRIRNVIYSNDQGGFTKVKLAELVHSSDNYISKFYRTSGYKSCLCKHH